MALYLAQVSYTGEGWATLIKNPQNREEAVRPAFEALGGRIIGWWLTVGKYDAVVIYELPDNIAAAALSVGVAAGGAVKAIKTSPLLTSEEMVEALRKAPGSGYRPPQ